MSVRREGREAAIQFLYQYDQGGDSGFNDSSQLQERLDGFFSFRRLSPAARNFCQEEILGTLQKLPEIDALLTEQTQNYELHRISAVDRNILRLGLYEIIYASEIPTAVTMNEAINIAKKYSTEQSGRFINGILDSVAKKTKKQTKK